MVLVRDSSDDRARIYRSLYLIRRSEEVIADIYPTDKIKSPVHLSIGQEAIAVGVCDALSDNDYVSATYRGHAAYLAKGGSLNHMMAELFGKATGCAEGKAGSMHLVDMSNNILGMSAVVGTNIPVAAGVALAIKMHEEKKLVAVFLGDGATEEGVFSETLNFAALHKLPILFICENNGYAIHSPLSARWATTRLCERVETYGIPSMKIDNGDILSIRSATINAISAIRAGDGPHFMECATYRWREHVGPDEDFNAGYRELKEAESWHLSDPVVQIGEMIESLLKTQIEESVDYDIQRAIEFAEKSPWPKIERLEADVYSN